MESLRGSGDLRECWKRDKVLIPALPLNTADLVLLSAAFKNNTVLRKLDIRGTRLKSNARSLLDALISCATLLNLNLANNGLESEEMLYVAKLLQTNRNLEDLRLSENPIGDGGCMTLCQAVGSHPGLKCLGISGIGITEVGAGAVADMLKINRVLATLYFTDNLFIGKSGSVCLINALGVNESLRTAILEMCRIGKTGVLALASCLRTNSVLTELTVDQRFFPRERSISIVEALETNRMMKSFHCGSLPVDLERARDAVIARNRALPRVRELHCRTTLVALVGMRKVRRRESGLLYEIPRDVLKLIGFRILATNKRVEWDLVGEMKG
jgi:hypothetical protein